MTVPATIFRPETETLLASATSLCESHGTKLTPLRRVVLGHVIESPRSVGAYDILHQLTAKAGPIAPPTIYRALDFLLDEGLIHRIEKLSAYVACRRHLEHKHQSTTHHAVQFLICRRCGQVVELEADAIATALADEAASIGFRPETMSVEVAGLCATCAGEATGFPAPVSPDAPSP